MRTRAALAALALAGCGYVMPPDPTPAPLPLAGIVAPPTALFASGFEKGVYLEAPTKQGDEWIQKIKGEDAGGGNWGTDLPQRDDPSQQSRFTNLVNGTRTLNQLLTYVDTSLVTEDGSRALKMELKREDTSNDEATRDQFGIYPEESLKQYYAKYRLKLQPDLDAALPITRTSSIILTESKMAGSPRADWRWNIFVQREAGVPGLTWRIQAQYGDQESSVQAWECVSSVPVPYGRWATMEVFWRLDPRAGRIWAAVDGATIVDYQRQTQYRRGIYVWWPFKLYQGGQLKQHPNYFYQFIDDVELAPVAPREPAPGTPGTNSCATFVEKY